MTRCGVVWITGAGKGIGRALALRYARLGHTVAASARTKTDLQSLAAEAEPLDGAIRPYALDVTDASAVPVAVAAIEHDLGRIDRAVLNAGTHIPTPVGAFSPGAWRTLLDVNVMGTVNCLAALFEDRAHRRGCRIAVVASVAGYRGLPSASAYGATKAALINMCEALKPELDALGIAVQLVNPGFVETPLTDKNDFPMPFLISAEEAARRIVDGLARDRFEIAFPTRFVMIMKMLRLLPHALFFPITRRMVR